MTVIPMDGALLKRRGEKALLEHWQRLGERPFVGGTQIRAPRYDGRHLMSLKEGDDAVLQASGLPASWPPERRARTPRTTAA